MGLEIIQFVQSFANPALDTLFTFFTIMGEEVFVAAVFAYIYWCADKEQGKIIGYFILTSICVNTLIKDLVRVPRPIDQPRIFSKRVETAPGYSFPSNHTQNAATLWLSIARWKKTRLVTALAVLMICAIGLSRVYLGVHYPTDVLGGFLIGYLVTLGMHKLYRPGRRFPLILSVCALLAMPISLLIDSEKLIIYLAAVVAYSILVHIEERFIRFSVPSKPGNKLKRYFIGIAMILTVELAFHLLPDNPSWIKAVRYSMDAGMILIGCPWIFQKFNV